MTIHEFEGRVRKSDVTNIRINIYVKDMLDSMDVISPEGIPMQTLSQKIHALIIHYKKIAK